MVTGITGTLLSQFFVQELLFARFAGQLGESGMGPAHASFCTWWRAFSHSAGPASSTRTLWERGARPVLELLGYRVDEPSHVVSPVSIARCHASEAALDLVVAPWGENLTRVWRQASRQDGIQNRWCVCFNGGQLRLVESARTYSDRFVEFTLPTLAADQGGFAVFWASLRASAFGPGPRSGSLFERLCASSTTHAVQVNASLQRGVLESLTELLTSLLLPRTRRETTPSTEQLAAALQGSLTVVYRVLFLLFAEARGLVPVWHPIYRDSYTIASLRAVIERPRKPRGLWETLQAIASLARDGCSAGDLRVSAFNGRLFARTQVDAGPAPGDGSLQRALLALSTTSAGASGRHRIEYRDLGVEQLGAVYEGVLDYTPVWSGGPSPAVQMRKGSLTRKATGTFYTPRSITEYLVRQTLRPLIRHATSEQILAIRILDPAMGSGAFLVAACRHLADAYETALVREGAYSPGDITESDRCTFKRVVAQRCLFGVDLNHTAVQLARLSLWLATLAADRPLTFLDHHLKAGDSLLGATPDDIARRAPPGAALSRSKTRPDSLPFFEDQELEATLRFVLPSRLRIEREPGDTLPAVQKKERLLARLSRPDGAMERWRRVADLWCACWFWPDGSPPSRPLYTALADGIRHGHSDLPRTQFDGLLQPALDTALRRQFFHWVLEFPEVFFEPDGRPRSAPGFDVVLGNPPWEMLRADPGSTETRASLRQKTRFIKDSGAYRYQGEGHLNLYQVFLERAVQLTRPGGRVGMAVPSGLLTDLGAVSLRRLMLQRCDTDTLVLLDNKNGVFPIHRSVTIALMTATKGTRTRSVSYRTGVRDPAVLDAVRGPSSPFFRLHVDPGFLERVSGSSCAIPELRTVEEASLLDRLASKFKPLGDAGGWHLSFGRELNATDDARHFTTSRAGVPVLEGKHIAPFRAHVEQCSRRIPRRALDPSRHDALNRPRLAYREVASATNRLTLIAAIVPPQVVTTHSVFCLKTPLAEAEQAFLCGLLNSFVANFLIRLFVTTHVTATAIKRLYVPKPDPADVFFRRIGALSERLAWRGDRWPVDYARLQANAALAYELTEDEFELVLGTFPLIETEVKAAALECFRKER